MKVIKRTHFGIQRKIVANMTTQSWEEIPHACVVYDADVTQLMAEFSAARKDGVYKNSVGVNTLYLRMIVEGIKAAPLLNSHLYFSRKLVRGELVTFEDINISMPYILPNGEMMTINLHNFENKSLDEMSEYISDVARRLKKTDLNEAMFEVSMDNTITALKKGRFVQTFGRLIGAKTGKHKVKTLSGKAKKEYQSIPKEDRITKHDIEQGTITVSNLGAGFREFNGCCTLLEIIPPQIFVVALTAIQDRAVVRKNEKGEKEIVIRQIMPITIAFDHRACEYGEIIPFMKRLEEITHNPAQIREW